MVHARCVDGFLNGHVVVHDVDHDAEDRIDDRPAAGAAGDEHDLALLRENGRGLRAEHAFPGGDQVGLGANAASFGGDAGTPVEVHHLVVEQEAGPLHENA